ncbi:MAG: hypothetical protein KGJ60_06530 [Verrucomicrobiota bacterium]|nr:hypothetical protein [Verrucomicrobiota bacterium]MDE3067194.1 hypothetical protein [Verrucomicrobiota bacterium]
MKCTASLLWMFTVIGGFGLFTCGADTVLLDDTWATGTRSTQNLPSQSAWYASSGSTLAATTGAMTGTDGTGSVEWRTYFTPNTPQTLNVGDRLQVSLTLKLAGVNTGGASTSRGVRIGLFDFSFLLLPA